MTGRRFKGQSRSPRPHRVRVIPILLALVAAIGMRSTAARGQALDGNLWVTDGDVGAIAPWGNTIYVGGTFGYVGPNSGGWTRPDRAPLARDRDRDRRRRRHPAPGARQLAGEDQWHGGRLARVAHPGAGGRTHAEELTWRARAIDGTGDGGRSETITWPESMATFARPSAQPGRAARTAGAGGRPPATAMAAASAAPSARLWA